MPSSHTATAAAYATAASLQHPLGALLAGPAAIVAWSRMRTRRHFPTDVIVGCLLGAAVGLVVGLALRQAFTDDAPVEASNADVARRRA